MPQMILGLDAGTHSIKGVLIQSSYRKFEVVDCFERRLPAQQGPLSADQYTLELRLFLAENGINADTVHTAVSGVEVASRILHFPFKDKRKIAEAIDFELEAYVPISPEDSISDHCILNNLDSEQTPVLASLLPKTQLKTFIDTLQNAEIHPKVIDLSCLNLSNLAKFGDPEMFSSEAPLAIVNLAEVTTDICILRKGQPVYTRSIDIGISIFGDQKERFAGVSDQVISKEKMAPLLSEIRRTLLAFKTHSGTQVMHFLVCGEGSLIPGIVPDLTRELGIPVQQMHIQGISFEALKTLGSRALLFLPALATALGAFPAEKNAGLNFRKSDFSFTYDLDVFQGSILKVAGVAFGVLAALLISFSFKHFMLKSQLAKTDQQIIQSIREMFPNKASRLFRNSTVALNILKTEMAKVTGDTQMIDELSEGQRPVLEILREISTHIPSALKLDISDLSISAPIIRFQGETDSFEAVDRIVAELKRSDFFESVEKGNVSSGVNNVKKFSMTITLASNKEGEN